VRQDFTDMDDIPDIHADAQSRDDEYYNDTHSELIRFLTQSHEMRAAARSALKQSIWAGTGAFTGSILGGPIGGLVGGVAGSIVGYMRSDEYDGALLQIINLQGERRQVSYLLQMSCMISSGSMLNKILIYVIQLNFIKI